MHGSDLGGAYPRLTATRTIDAHLWLRHMSTFITTAVDRYVIAAMLTFGSDAPS
jgi:hypothetical protein